MRCKLDLEGMKDVLWPLLSFRILVLTAGLVDPVLLSLPVWKAVGVSCRAAGSKWPPSQVVTSLIGSGLPHR